MRQEEVSSPVSIDSWLQISFARDYKTAKVTTTADAPGGARTEKVALPFDPDLYHHIVTHDIFVIKNTFVITRA